MNDGFEPNRRILVIDDNESIQQDFRRILTEQNGDCGALDSASAAFFGSESTEHAATMAFHVDTAAQGQDGVAKVREALHRSQPYAVAFVDMRMPPGWDGVETIEHLWDADEDLQVVLCTAYSDYTWEQTTERLGHTDRLLVLKKPFDNIEARQIACALTEKWEAHRQARIKLDELAEIVRQRTREIEQARDEVLVKNDELLKARTDAEQANRAKSAFLANMSHEIRTPMTAILGWVEMLADAEREAIPFSQRIEALETIRRNGEHLLNLINQILDLSKIEAGMLEVERIAASPQAVVADVMTLMGEQAEKKSIELKHEYVGPIPTTVLTDPMRVRQILINLVGNAIRFTDVGGVRLVTRRVVKDGCDPKLQFDVIDSGIGMTPEQVGELFQPFHQADLSTTRKYGGTGLGLSISQRLARLLGGDISVDSVLGQGSTFCVTIAAGPCEMLNLAPSDSFSPLEPQPTPQNSEPCDLPTLSCRVLLIEDGPDNQRLIKFILEKAGAQVDVAENGQVGVTMALGDGLDKPDRENFPYDVILMDMQMPVMNGYDAARILRQKGYKGPIIALTAHAMASDRDKCIEAGCNDYATKPISRKKLIETITAHLHAHA